MTCKKGLKCAFLPLTCRKSSDSKASRHPQMGAHLRHIGADMRYLGADTAHAWTVADEAFGTWAKRQKFGPNIGKQPSRMSLRLLVSACILEGCYNYLVETRGIEPRSNRGMPGRRYVRSLCFKSRFRGSRRQDTHPPASPESRVSAEKLCCRPSRLCDALSGPNGGSPEERAT